MCQHHSAVLPWNLVAKRSVALHDNMAILLRQLVCKYEGGSLSRVETNVAVEIMRDRWGCVLGPIHSRQASQAAPVSHG